MYFSEQIEPVEPFRNFHAQDLLSITYDIAAKSVHVNRMYGNLVKYTDIKVASAYSTGYERIASEHILNDSVELFHLCTPTIHAALATTIMRWIYLCTL